MLNDYKKRLTNLEMTWTNNKKAYDMISHFLVFETIELVQLSENIVQFIMTSMKHWNTTLKSCGKCVIKVDIRRGICRRTFVTTAFCDLYGTPVTDIKKDRIRVNLEKWRKVEPAFVYGWLIDLCKEWAWSELIGFHCTDIQK